MRLEVDTETGMLQDTTKKLCELEVFIFMWSDMKLVGQRIRLLICFKFLEIDDILGKYKQK